MRRAAFIRRWSRQASRSERAWTVFVAAVVVAVIGAALVPARSEQAAEGARAGAGRTAGTAIVPHERVTTTIAGAVGSRDGRSPVGPAAADPGRAASPDRGPVRGVTATSIKVGFTIIDPGAAELLGYWPGLREDVSEAIDALVEDANERGGVLGRKIEAVKVSPSFIDADDQRVKCLELTESRKVFAVIDSLAFAADTSMACIAAEHKTLLVSSTPSSAAHLRTTAPLQVSLHKDDNRTMKDLAASAKAAGFFEPANGFRRLGVLDPACARSIFDGDEGLFAHLRAAGVTEWTEHRMTCDATAATREAAAAVVKFADAGVTHVLVATGPPFLKEYLDAAARAQFSAKYFVSDYFRLILGGLVETYNKRAFEGALGVTQTHVGHGPARRPLPPPAKRCSDIFVAHGVAPVSTATPEDIGDDLEVLELCENFMLFLDVASRAGPHLSNDTWLGALAQTGEFRGATVDLARFDRPGKFTGGDTTKLVQWRADCSCWHEVTPFTAAAG